MINKLISIGIVCLVVFGGFIGLLKLSTMNAKGMTVVSGIAYDSLVGPTGGPWTVAGSPYTVVGDVTVPAGETLTIEPGVEVKFDGYYSIYVDGTFMAVGTDLNRVIITSNMSAPTSGDWNRIQINSIGHAEIKYCNISYGDSSIYFDSSSNNNIANNNIYSNDWEGIRLNASSNNNLTNNTILNNGWGIYLMASSNNNITYNTISIESNGITLEMSSNNTITNNNISNNAFGICLYSSSNNNMTDNNFINDGISILGTKLSHFNTHTIPDDNLVNGKPLFYYKDRDGIIIDGNYVEVGQLILANCTDFDVKNLQINNTDAGIEVAYSKNINISNNNISSNFRYGLYLWSSSNSTIINSNFYSNCFGGIYLESSSDNNKITDNDISSCEFYGISLKKSSYNRVRGNNISDGEFGISLFFSTNNDITKNNVSNHLEGIDLLESSNNNITDNIVTLSTWNGLAVFGSSNNTITYNNLSRNEMGIYLGAPSNNNTITNNDIYSNNGDGITLTGGSNNNIVANNNIINNSAGINIFGSNNMITINIISWNNGYGIRFGSSSNNYIADNIVSNNNNSGIFLVTSSNNNISNNKVSSNVNYGIHLTQFSNNNMISGNNVSSNGWYGIWLDCSNNHIYHNDIIDNVNQAYDATDMGNQWDNGYPSGGNYWSDFDEPSDGAYDDYKGPNQDVGGNDGIVDNGTSAGGGKNPYVIDSDSQDNYPLIKPYNNYLVLKQGWNLISIPRIQIEQNLSKVLASIDGLYDAVQWYDITDTVDPWKHYKVGKPYGNDLSDLNETMGFWIHIIQSGDTIFLCNGTQPTSNQTITLHPGWNLVGYPSLTSYNRTQGLNNLTFGTHVDAIWTYNSATQEWKKLGPSDYFEPGKGYWVHSRVKKVWEVPL